ncbi:YajD family HNH nuclease [uncultured Dechloromonas sp.]|uniref:YajD family HNH nuclease n=1 Tax=uncultured Dechloromonas sp. TaxID=171719 RepID=UPI0025FDA970|nr:YajD family HNH nuclease [uncultured Dechloromonas sp.]
MKQIDHSRLDQIVLDARKAADARAEGYREKALKIYPWICGRCAREFTHANLRELTVHHRDHNHDNNPADGSNWELLCLYCHDTHEQEYVDIHPSCFILWTCTTSGVSIDGYNRQFGRLPSRADDARRRAAARRRVGRDRTRPKCS